MIPLPEPDLTPQTLIERARALIPAVRAQQDEAERLGHHTAELGRQFTEAGFYRILQPRQFGGYAFGLPTFWRVMLAISAGDPGTGWALTLAAHALPYYRETNPGFAAVARHIFGQVLAES